MNVYTYNAELLCEPCGEATIELLGNYIDEEDRDDSETWPQGPTEEGGGPADSPQHCGKCGIFLQNPLTNEGVLHVLEALGQDPEDMDEDQRDGYQEWAEFYDLGPDETDVWAINEAEAE